MTGPRADSDSAGTPAAAAPQCLRLPSAWPRLDGLSRPVDSSWNSAAAASGARRWSLPPSRRRVTPSSGPWPRRPGVRGDRGRHTRAREGRETAAARVPLPSRRRTAIGDAEAARAPPSLLRARLGTPVLAVAPAGRRTRKGCALRPCSARVSLRYGRRHSVLPCASEDAIPGRASESNEEAALGLQSLADAATLAPPPQGLRVLDSDSALSPTRTPRTRPPSPRPPPSLRPVPRTVTAAASPPPVRFARWL